MARPRPVPPRLREMGASACTNGWNSRSWSSAEMPMPVSATTISMRCRSLVVSRTRARIDTVPVSVNLTPLPTRLKSTCRRRTGSKRRRGASWLSACHSRARALRRAPSAKVSATLRISSPMDDGAGASVRWPASTFDRSSTSLRIWSSDCDEALMTPSMSRCSRLVVEISSSSTIPRMAFIGVRISWLMAARNALLARLAVSAASRASRSVRSASMSDEMSTQ